MCIRDSLQLAHHGAELARTVRTQFRHHDDDQLAVGRSARRNGEDQLAGLARALADLEMCIRDRLVTARIDPRYAGQGLGRVLVQSAAKHALRRGYRAMEAFGAGAPNEPCLLPVDFLTAVGFHTVREHAAYPRLRLDLRTALALSLIHI